MEHFRQAVAAYEARQFVEADLHLSQAVQTASGAELKTISELRHRCAKVLRPETCWRELSAHCRLLAAEGEWPVVLTLLREEEESIPMHQQAFMHELRAAAHFQRGELLEARDHAIKHVELLLKKKLSAALVRFAEVYHQAHPHSLYFLFARLQAATLLEDVAAAESHYLELLQAIQRRWEKMEDKSDTGKQALLQTALESIRLMESGDAAAVLLAHRAQLYAQLLMKQPLAKEDWKKLVELMVDQDSWANLKLVLELAIAQDAREVALEAYATLKKKRGFSIVKLTKFDPALKLWLNTHAAVRTQPKAETQPLPKLSAEDLKLTEEPVKRRAPLEAVELEADEEERFIEQNAIKQIEHEVRDVALWPDLLVAYKTMGMNRVVSWLLREASERALPSELMRRVRYFHLIHAMDRKEFHLALALVEELLGEADLGIEEFKELMYAQGGIFLRLGQLKEAKASLAEVARLDPHYRQLRERMEALE